MTKNTYLGTYTTAPEPQESLTLEKLLMVMAKIPKNPIEKFANDNGFSLDKGDKLIVPPSRYDLVAWHKNVQESHFIGSEYAYFIRGTELRYFIKSDIRGDINLYKKYKHMWQ